MGKFIDMTGWNMWEHGAPDSNWKVIKRVKDYISPKGQHVPRWLCECQCEHHTRLIMTRQELKTRMRCQKCFHGDDLFGQQFGRWVATGHSFSKNGKTYTPCICSCEAHIKKDIRNDMLIHGISTSCGCYDKERRLTRNGESRIRIFKIWDGMVRRCTDKNNPRFKDYGGRGIEICNDWVGPNGFDNFKQWALANGYEDNLTIERNNVNGDYEPSNCTWILMKEQAKNKRNTIYYTDEKNNKISVSDLSERTNLMHGTIQNRVLHNVDEEKLTRQLKTNNTSGITGVSYSNTQNNYRAYININSKRIELGRSKDFNEAVRKRLLAEEKYFGENAPQRHLFSQYGITGYELLGQSERIICV